MVKFDCAILNRAVERKVPLSVHRIAGAGNGTVMEIAFDGAGKSHRVMLPVEIPNCLPLICADCSKFRMHFMPLDWLV